MATNQFVSFISIYFLKRWKKLLTFSVITSKRVLNLSDYSYYPFLLSPNTFLFLRSGLLVQSELSMSKTSCFPLLHQTAFDGKVDIKHHSSNISSIKITNMISYLVNNSIYNYKVAIWIAMFKHMILALFHYVCHHDIISCYQYKFLWFGF